MHETRGTILLIEDEPQIRKFLRISLEAHHLRVLEASGGEEGIESAAANRPQLVILDLGLPDIDGLQVIKRIREWSELPILVLSVRHDENDKVQALDAGADDYVTKPAGISELMARVRVLLRKRDPDKTEASEYDRNGLRIDFARHRVAVNGLHVHVTRKEYELLCLLVQGSGTVLTHQKVLRALWGPSFISDNHYLRVLVSGLRRKLGDDPGEPKYIGTEQGLGYRLLE
jgi:two-component system KDP operon response regulator KdpE